MNTINIHEVDKIHLQRYKKEGYEVVEIVLKSKNIGLFRIATFSETENGIQITEGKQK